MIGLGVAEILLILAAGVVGLGVVGTLVAIVVFAARSGRRQGEHAIAELADENRRLREEIQRLKGGAA